MNQTVRQAVLGAGLVLAPLAWFASLEGNFALAPLACAGHGKGMLLLVSTAALGLAIVSGILAWTQRDLHRRLAISGTVVSALFSLVILAQAIPNLMLGGCE
jgi:predicted permease